VPDKFDDHIISDMVSYGRFVYFEGSSTDVVKLFSRANDADLDERKAAFKFGKVVPFISVENEIKIWKYISGAIEANLEGYETTLKEDMALLKKDKDDKFLTNNE